MLSRAPFHSAPVGVVSALIVARLVVRGSAWSGTVLDTTGHGLMTRLIDSISTGVPDGLEEIEKIGRTL